jgi:hypothetical protein
LQAPDESDEADDRVYVHGDLPERLTEGGSATQDDGEHAVRAGDLVEQREQRHQSRACERRGPQSAGVSSPVGPVGLAGLVRGRDLPSLRSIPQNESSSGVVRNRIGILAGHRGPSKPVKIRRPRRILPRAGCQLRVVGTQDEKAAGRVRRVQVLVMISRHQAKSE